MKNHTCSNNNSLISNSYIKESLHSIQQLLFSMIDVNRIAFIMVDNENNIKEHSDEDYVIIDNDFLDKYHSFIKLTDNCNELVAMIELYLNDKYESLIYPIHNNEMIYGYLIFTHDKVSCKWNSNNREILINASLLFKNLLFGTKHNNEFDHSSILYNMINKINTHIYVTDLKTDRILYMNEKMRKDYFIDSPIGQICWKVLRNDKQQRCENCPVPYLLDHPNEEYAWEDVCTINDKIYQSYDSLIHWFDGSIVHFQHSHDITDIKRIVFDASFDELTGIYNRKTGYQQLTNQLYNCKKEKKLIQVCLFDIDNLKITNDVYGHIEGDHMLKVITKAVKEKLNDNDIIFRISGDEFIVSFYDYSYDTAYQYMMSVLKDLKHIVVEENFKYDLSYCFGIIEIDSRNTLPISDIISAADEKMYTWKKRRHLRNAQLELKKDNQTPIDFDYDKDSLYDALAKSTDDYIFICNMKTGVFRYTPEMVKEFNFPSEIIKNAAAIFGSKIHRDDKYEFLNSNQQITDGKTDNHIVEYRALNKDNDWVWLRCRGQVGYDKNHEPSIFTGFISNLGKKNSMDILTSLYNKTEFQKRVNDMEGMFSILIINIDDFKSINSLYNREFGDNVLRIIAQNIQTILHNDGTLFKLDGDEFGFITKQTDFDSLNVIFDKIQNYANQQHSYEDKIYTFTISSGVAIAPKNGDNYLELQRNAELALQYAKRKRRGTMVIVNSKIRKEKTRVLELTNALKQDINNHFNNFHLVYQPIIDTQNERILKVEALCRWNNKNIPNVSPGEFIPILEETGDIIKLGRWVFIESIKQLREWLDINSKMSISINVSYLELIENRFVEDIKDIIDKYNVPYNHVIIELTETAISKNTNLILKNITELRNLGIQIAMDDFGTGYSSLAALKDEPLDIIKIDRTFVIGIENDPFNFAFIKLMIELCHQANLSVLIEGIETKIEYDTLLSLYPDYIQGYYTGHPMDSHSLLPFIKIHD